jgi:hypothetical protein
MEFVIKLVLFLLSHKNKAVSSKEEGDVGSIVSPNLR